MALVRKARQMGLNIPDKCINGGYEQTENYLDIINQKKRCHENLSLAICIMPDGSSPKDRSMYLF